MTDDQRQGGMLGCLCVWRGLDNRTGSLNETTWGCKEGMETAMASQGKKKVLANMGESLM